MITIGDVVQFNESHKWRGALGTVDSMKGNTIVVAIPIVKGDEVYSAYIRCYDYQIEYIGRAILIPGE